MDYGSRKGLGSASYYFKEQLTDKIRSRRTISFLSSQFKIRIRGFKTGFNNQKGNEKNPWWRRRRAKKIPYDFLAERTRYLIEDEVLARVGFSSSQYMKRGKFDPALNISAGRMEKGFKFKVTPKMRRFVGLSKRWGGVGLNKETRYIVGQKRPTLSPVFQKGKSVAVSVYKNRFLQEVKDVISNIQ